MTRALVWFRRDLRTRDNPALHEAARTSPRGVVGAFVISPGEWRAHDDAPAKIDFWLRNVRELSAALDRLHIPLRIVLAGRLADVPRALLTLALETRCDALHFNHEYEVDERRRDERVGEAFRARGLRVCAWHGRVLLDPASIRAESGGFYAVFSAFRRRMLARLREGGVRTLPRPGAQASTGIEPSPVPGSVAGFPAGAAAADWPAGESAALARLRRFCRGPIERYHDARDRPGEDGTSRLSAYLNAGVISPSQCLAAAIDANDGRLPMPERGGARRAGAGPGAWISELLWREFYQHVLVGFPRVSMGRAFRPATDRIAWDDDAERLERWARGQTGVPIVDAGMRQLAATGWMHNRARMIAAMYLVKDLFIDWRLGERHFMRHLVDGDLGSNNGGWQWCASTGCDAVPYFRVFNPDRQAARFDAAGAYVRRWVPELAEVEARALHDPGRLEALRRRGLAYPRPMVDHAAARARVLRAFGARRSEG